MNTNFEKQSIIMKQLFFLSVLILLISGFYSKGIAQLKLDWSDYKEPDGKIWFLRLNPTSDIWTRRDLRLRADYNFREIKNQSLLDVDLDLFYINQHSESDITTSYLTFQPEINYTKYLKKRRGLFLQTKNDIYYSKALSENRIDDLRLTNSVGIGFGRLEEISAVNQSMRILENIEELSDKLNPESQSEVFSLAILLRQLDYYFERDGRIRTIKRVEQFLSYFKDKSIDLNNPLTTAQLIDGYYNSRNRPFVGGFFSSRSIAPTALENVIIYLANDPIGDNFYGQKISLEIEHWRNNDPNELDLKATSLKLDLMKSFAISNYIRTNIFGLGHYFINSDYVKHAYRFGASGFYTPNARTQVGITAQYKGVANEFEDLKYLQLNTSVSYFISFRTVLTGWFRFYDTDNYIERNNNFSVSLVHYIY